MPRAAGWENPETQADIITALRGGKGRHAAARIANVSITTLEGWIERVEQFKARVDAAEEYAATHAHSAKREHKAGTRFDIIKNEAAKLGAGIIGLLLFVDGLLASKGFVSMSAWWHWTFTIFYESGLRWLIARIGRGGGKSTIALCRPCVVECLFGDHSWLGPGEVAIWPLMSVDMQEANAKTGVIVAILEVLGIEYNKRELPLGRTLISFADIAGKSIEIRVYPATVTAASGPTLAGCGCDEESKWRNDSAKGTNDARAVLSSLGPAFRAHEGTHGYRVSSAWLEHGTHFDDVEKGDTKNRMVAKLGPFVEQVRADLMRLARSEEPENAKALIAYAAELTEDSPNIPTWLSRPDKTPEQWRAEAETFDEFMREYVSRSSGAAASSFFDGIRLVSALSMPKPTGRLVARHAAIDPGSSNNAFALAIVDTIETDDGLCYWPSELREWIPVPGAPLDTDREVFPEAASIVQSKDVREWQSDTHLSTSFQLRSQEKGLLPTFVSTNTFEEVYEPARTELHRGKVALGGHGDMSTELRRQLTMVRSHARDDGKVKIEIKEERNEQGGRVHGDLGVAFVRALALAAKARRGSNGGSIMTVRSRYGRPWR